MTGKLPLTLTAGVLASLMAFSGAAFAANHGGKGGHDGGRNRDNHGNRHSDFIWKRHENGCAVGNTPPPGANCTNRDTD